MLNQDLPSLEQLNRSFVSALPFRHISIDNFLDPDFAEALLEQFPVFDHKRAVDEMGKVGRKATREDVRSLGSAYTAIDDYISSPSFLSFISGVTGIPDLQYDAEYFGGGTHENLHGQELDVHVDFNYNKTVKLHRRLNLIVYLNKEWGDDWGGEIEIHSNPREPERNEIVSFAPIFNRCVMFETNEHSWHGFPLISLPVPARHRSRKSFAIYLYSATRPESEIAPPHKTFYVQRPLSNKFCPGVTLTEEQYVSLKGLIQNRDTWIYFYQRLELSLSGEIEALKRNIEELGNAVRIPTLGYISAVGSAINYHPDQWIGDQFSVSLYAHRAVLSIDLTVSTPKETPEGHTVGIYIDRSLIRQVTLTPGHRMVIPVECGVPALTLFTLSIRGKSFSPKQLGLNSDERQVLLNLESVTGHHNATAQSVGIQS